MSEAGILLCKFQSFPQFCSLDIGTIFHPGLQAL